MNMTSSRYQETMTRMQKVMRREQPDRVPILANIYGWAVQYYGYSMLDIYRDKPELGFELFTRLADEFKFDGFFDLNTSIPFPMLEPLGGQGNYRLTEEGVQVCNHSSRLMNDDEYPMLIEDPEAFLQDVIIPRKFNVLAGGSGSFEALKESLEKFMWFQSRRAPVTHQIEEYGIPIFGDGQIHISLDFIMDFFRDFTGIIKDIRRQPEQVKEACRVLQKSLIDANIRTYKSRNDAHFIFVPMHLAPYLRPKDFAEFYFPLLKDLCHIVVNDFGYNLGLYIEGCWEPYYDIMQDLPDNKGNIIGLLEKGDFKKFKNELGHKMCIAGGMPTDLLAFASKETCIEFAKKLLDDCMPEGGYVFGFDKPLLALTDAKPENLKAVFEFVNEYGKY